MTSRSAQDYVNQLGQVKACATSYETTLIRPVPR
jgi:hypothetical protein